MSCFPTKAESVFIGQSDTPIMPCHLRYYRAPDGSPEPLNVVAAISSLATGRLARRRWLII